MNNKRIKKIEPIPILPSFLVKKIERVAVYARVSTDKEEQQTSIQAQKDYYTKLIENNENWVIAGVYADEGITGTSFNHRIEFQRMMCDCRNGLIDRILTKSVSRFARNTVDALKAIRELKERGIGIYFEKENIWTLDSKGEFLITLMTSLAQEESRSISENITWAHRKRFSDGKYSLGYSGFVGYDKGFIINEKEAVVICKIYKLFLQGYSSHAIASILTSEHIPSAHHLNNWHSQAIRSILKNEKYKGDALSQKYFTVNYLGHKMKKNEGELPQYYVEGGHEAIINRFLFDYVQQIIENRKAFEQNGYKYSGNSMFSNKFVCGKCGATFQPKLEHSNNKYRKTVWMCRNRFNKALYCKNTRIYDVKAEYVYCKIAMRYIGRHKSILELCKKICTESDVADLISEVDNYKSFCYADMEDLSIVINKIEVFPENKIRAYFIDGAKVQLTLSDYVQTK